MKVDPCLKCGTPMYRGTICPHCGAPDRIGRAAEVSKGIAALLVSLLLFGLVAFVVIAYIWALVPG